MPRSVKPVRRPIGADEVLVVTPYNAQIRAIQDALAPTGCSAGVRVGTVDKFQGREAPVAIYPMARSSADDVPRDWSSSATRTG
jgi:superfamily I DNA and/or RNA helicase